MTKAIEPALRRDPADNRVEVETLDSREFELVRQAMVEAFDSGEDCEIEQMMRLRNVLPVRRRVQVRLERDLHDKVAAVHVSVERDGEPIAVWIWTLAEASHIGHSATINAINAFTAVVLHAEAVKRHVARSQLAEASSSIDHILANVHRVWKHVGGLCRQVSAPVT
ncbi:glutamate mutase epsilon subunit [Ancylobacter sp. 3268]|uniref:hypothetical protein n=1 Tax=Ancylobacter sp. 3268 TaxID=2817752 RepID=UPI00285CB742|nr:hypothetical protein [Ancylobacter sp. 3268]MDR6950684.1 glutamate mutase epsilon subunit [Ancylobacter sp. 3268]